MNKILKECVMIINTLLETECVQYCKITIQHLIEKISLKFPSSKWR